MTVTISLLQVTPAGMVVSWNKNRHGTLTHSSGYNNLFTVPGVTAIVDTTKTPPSSVIVRIDFGSCKVDKFFASPS